jgi:hypothetical protein
MRALHSRVLVRLAAAPAALLLLGGAGMAQTTPPAPPAVSPNANCTPDTRQGAQRGPPGGSQNSTVGSGSNLSDKLAGSNGVICPPPGVDPEMHKPAPGGGRMPVIPPPGTPGGDPNTVPK